MLKNLPPYECPTHIAYYRRTFLQPLRIHYSYPSVLVQLRLVYPVKFSENDLLNEEVSQHSTYIFIL
jgi:hypothetical protein